MESWKDVEGYEGVYLVSSIGNIKSIRTGKLMKYQTSEKGYFRVGLSMKGCSENFAVHRIVAAAFIPNPDNKSQVNHINGIKTDNRLENLEWCTNRENTSHYYKNKPKTSRFTGVSFNKREGKWFSQIFIRRKAFVIGRFASEIEAHQAYQNKLKEINTLLP